MITTATIGKGKAIHALFGTDRTLCKRNFNNDNAALPVQVDAPEVTCKKCLKEIAAEVEQAHAEAITMDEERTIARAYLCTPAEVVLTEEEVAQAIADRHAETEAFLDNAARESAQRSRETADAITAYQIQRAENMDRIREEDHAEAIEIEMGRLQEQVEAQFDHYPHMAGWRAADGKLRTCDVLVHSSKIMGENNAHQGPCYDAVRQEWREEVKPTRKQRRAARREARATLRKTTPQTRAAARARRAQRGAARAAAKTLLVAAGVPQDVAQRYAPAFSRGVQVPTAPTRVRTGEHKSKRVEVKRYTWEQFTDRLSVYAPGDLLAAGAFYEARDRVLA